MLRRTCAYTARRARRSATVRWSGAGTASTRAPTRFARCRPLRAVVAFEENPEEVEGHYFYIAGEEHRVIRLDAVILSFPLE